MAIHATQPAHASVVNGNAYAADDERGYAPVDGLVAYGNLNYSAA